MKSVKPFMIAFSTLALASVSLAQIRVEVDGSPVRFDDAAPKMTGGRVLVPLRAVLEKMGAEIKFDPATSVVTAIRGDKTVVLRLGSREASVNGQVMLLDVPAQAVSGRTYIPLRFFGEALGADVGWRAYDELVTITTSEDGVDTNVPPIVGGGNLRIMDFTHTAQGWVTAGQRIDFILRADPGQKASVLMDNGKIEVKLTESQAGMYVGTYTVPASGANNVAFTDADVIAVLGEGNQRTAMKARENLRVDNQGPNFEGLSPERGKTILQSRPVVTANITDGSGSGLQRDSVKIWLNGDDVTRQAVVSNSVLFWRPDADLKAGNYEVRLSARDIAGNESMVTT